MNGLFISDLHLFSQRSIGQWHWEQHQALIKSAKAVVLGGDMFDIRWSQQGSLDATIAAAADWLNTAVALNPEATWVYLLGNHDCHPRIQEMLQSQRDRHRNFRWSENTWRIGSNVFLHGDILDGQRHFGGLDVYRSKFHEDRAKGRLGNMMYSAVIQTRIHGLIPRLRHRHTRTCQRLVEYLEGQGEGFLNDVSDIYFGHTHVPLTAYEFDRFRFHNVGSGIRHLQFSPAKFEVPQDHD
jgi:UDP-2,3-diacylglucosamine pyrophosphatase LpxH